MNCNFLTEILELIFRLVPLQKETNGQRTQLSEYSPAVPHELHKETNVTKNKIASFLEKAVSGKLLSERPKPESPKQRIVDCVREEEVTNFFFYTR